MPSLDSTSSETSWEQAWEKHGPGEGHAALGEMEIPATSLPGKSESCVENKDHVGKPEPVEVKADLYRIVFCRLRQKVCGQGTLQRGDINCFLEYEQDVD